MRSCSLGTQESSRLKVTAGEKTASGARFGGWGWDWRWEWAKSIESGRADPWITNRLLATDAVLTGWKGEEEGEFNGVIF